MNTADWNMLTQCSARRGILRSTSQRCTSECERKKIVRFSDLEQVQCTIKKLSTDDDPCRSESMYQFCKRNTINATVYELEKQFSLPNEEDLQLLVIKQSVHLESIRWYSQTITGIVRVLNIAYHKQIAIVYTYDGWETIRTTYGAYSDSPTHNQDQFSFCIFLPYLQLDMRVIFCIQYAVCGTLYWDSRDGLNYEVHCKPLIATNTTFFDMDCSILF